MEAQSNEEYDEEDASTTLLPRNNRSSITTVLDAQPEDGQSSPSGRVFFHDGPSLELCSVSNIDSQNTQNGTLNDFFPKSTYSSVTLASSNNVGPIMKPWTAPLDEQSTEKSTGPLTSSINQFRRYFYDNWGFEWMCLAVTFGTFFTLIILLIRTDEQPLPKWPLDLTVGSAVAICSTVIKGTITIPLAKCTSQLKWAWFKQRSRPLAAMEHFDRNRDIKGATQFLWHIRHRSVSMHQWFFEATTDSSAMA